jgi:hypothetical protein
MTPFASADSHTDFESGADPAHASADLSAERPNAERPRETNASGSRADGSRGYAPDVSGTPADPRRDAEEKTREEEIEVTPEMIEAGADACRLWGLYSDQKEAAECIYVAMEETRRKYPALHKTHT